MRSKFILTVAAGLLAGTIAASAQPSGAPSNDRDRTGQPTDSGVTSTTPNRQGGTQGQGGTMGTGAPQSGPAMPSDTPLQPGGISPNAPPQGGAGGESAQPRPR